MLGRISILYLSWEVSYTKDLTKTKYIRYNSSNTKNKLKNIVKLDGQEVLIIFIYLGSFIQ